MISEQFVDIILPLVPWMDDGVCDVSINKEIAGIEYDKLDSLSSFLLGQTPITNLDYKEFSSWKLDLNNYSSSNLIDVFFNSDEKWPINFQKSGNLLLLDILSPNTLAHWIKINSSVRYLYIPISFSPEYQTKRYGFAENVCRSGHACSLVIDNALNEIYFFDPNGETSYFGSFGLNPIDTLFEHYFRDFDIKHSLGYTYVSDTTKFYELNRDFSWSTIANPGNCMILSIMFPHFLALTQSDIYTGVSKLGNLEDSELLALVNGYSVGICRLMLAN
jgi:hypothetical protein